MKATGDGLKDCFDGGASRVREELASLKSGELSGLYRTQDVKLLLPKFSIARKGEIREETRPAGHVATSFLDRLNRILIKDDMHYSKFKFERQSNFKP